MTTRTIRETDITIFDFPQTEQRGARRIYVLREKFRANPSDEAFRNYAEALQARADIIDTRAGAARVDDLVRIGRGEVVYRVESVSHSTAAIYPVQDDAPGMRRTRRVELDRLHAVEAKR